MELERSLVAVLAGELARATADEAVVCVGCPLGYDTAAALIATVPIALVRPPFESLPLGWDRLLLVVCGTESGDGEIAERCARAGVPELWLLREAGERLERLGEPRAGRYRRRSLILPGERVALIALPGAVLTPLPGGGPG
jgi:hypothetical protein